MKLHTLLGCLLGLVLMGGAAMAAEATGAWLNVQDLGASGSEFQTTATSVADSNQITVADPGDFKVGQGVGISRCNIRYLSPGIWGPTEPYSTHKALGDIAEFRGYDGSAGSWIVYIVEVDGTDPVTFRWSDDLARTWKARKVPVTYDWQELSGGMQIKINKRDLQKGHMITLSARDQLFTTITKIEGKILTLKDPANRSAADCVVRHDDYRALQAAIKQAISEKRNLFFPAGYYRLSSSLVVAGDLRVEGVDGQNTVLDLSDGQGSCFALQGGTDITVRNFRMIGHTPLAQAAGAFTTSGGFGFWACALKGCNAVSIVNTERVLIENVHASHMASEAFYCQGSGRTSKSEPTHHTKSLTWSRCSATDCAANGFNNNDTSENIYMLNCRVDGVGWHAYEGPARFIHVEGCYIRNAGPITIGDMSHRSDDLHQLGCGQAVVRNNVFEGIGRSEGVGINHGSGQVVVADNLFINYNGTAVNASSYTVRTSYPSRNIIIKDNIIDMTYSGDKPAGRTAIIVTASNTTVADNQIYVRGKVDPLVTGIRLAEPALNVNVHDNLIQNCGSGIRTARIASTITEVIDKTTFLENGLPLEWKDSHLYQGWQAVWLAGGKGTGSSTIDAFDATTLRFKLREPRELAVGQRFEVYPASGANWNLHHNTVTGCLNPVVLDSYGSVTSVFNDNIIQRGQAVGVKEVCSIRGLFRLARNQFAGFDEPGCATLSLYPDRLGKPAPCRFVDNTFDQCLTPIAETAKGLWEACTATGNVFLGGGAAPHQSTTTSTAKPSQGPVPKLVPVTSTRPTINAFRFTQAPVIDGQAKEWPWTEAKRVATLGQSAEGGPISEPKPLLLAGWDAANLYLALKVPLPAGYTLQANDGPYSGEGAEISIQSGDPKAPGPICILWTAAAGSFQSINAGGMSAAQVAAWDKQVTYATHRTPQEWTAEAKIPWSLFGMSPKPGSVLLFNAAIFRPATKSWMAWVSTGAALFSVDRAGDIVLQR